MPSYQPVPTSDHTSVVSSHQSPSSNMSSTRGFKLAEAALPQPPAEQLKHTAPAATASAAATTSQQASDAAYSDFVISLMHNGATIKVPCSPAWTLGQLKQHAFPAESNLAANKVIRFIYLGRVLSDDHMTLKQAGLESGHALHAMITDKPLTVELIAGGGPQHGAATAVPVQAHANGYIASGNFYPAQNYQYLHTLAAEYQMQHPHAAAVDQNQQPHQQFGQQIDDGNQSDFMLGALMGVLLGPLSVFFLLLRVGSRRLKLGIVSGLLLNLLFTLINAIFAVNDGHGGGGGHQHRQNGG